MFVKPGAGPSPDDPKKLIPLVVRYPNSRQQLPADGADVPEDSFWLCRLRDKDVVRAEPPKETAAAASAEPASEAETPPAPAALTPGFRPVEPGEVLPAGSHVQMNLGTGQSEVAVAPAPEAVPETTPEPAAAPAPVQPATADAATPPPAPSAVPAAAQEH